MTSSQLFDIFYVDLESTKEYIPYSSYVQHSATRTIHGLYSVQIIHRSGIHDSTWIILTGYAQVGYDQNFQHLLGSPALDT
jgi:hypothetical protein